MKNMPPEHSFKYGNTTTRIFHVNKNEGLTRHEHEFSHLTICYAGSCIIRKEGKEKVIDSRFGPLNLAANEWHEIEALEDGTVFVNIFVEGKY